MAFWEQQGHCDNFMELFNVIMNFSGQGYPLGLTFWKKSVPEDSLIMMRYVERLNDVIGNIKIIPVKSELL